MALHGCHLCAAGGYLPGSCAASSDFCSGTVQWTDVRWSLIVPPRPPFVEPGDPDRLIAYSVVRSWNSFFIVEEWKPRNLHASLVENTPHIRPLDADARHGQTHSRFAVGNHTKRVGCNRFLHFSIVSR